jgi:hypothetical protein
MGQNFDDYPGFQAKQHLHKDMQHNVKQKCLKFTLKNWNLSNKNIYHIICNTNKTY